MKPASPRILAINGGSSSIKFALFEAGGPLRRVLEGEIERIGLPETNFRVKDLNRAESVSRPVPVGDYTAAVGALMDWIEEQLGRGGLTAWGIAWFTVDRVQQASAESPPKWSRSCTGSVRSILTIFRRRSCCGGVSSPTSGPAPSGLLRYGISQ